MIENPPTVHVTASAFDHCSLSCEITKATTVLSDVDFGSVETKCNHPRRWWRVPCSGTELDSETTPNYRQCFHSTLLSAMLQSSQVDQSASEGSSAGEMLKPHASLSLLKNTAVAIARLLAHLRFEPTPALCFCKCLTRYLDLRAHLTQQASGEIRLEEAKALPDKVDELLEEPRRACG